MIGAIYCPTHDGFQHTSRQQSSHRASYLVSESCNHDGSERNIKIITSSSLSRESRMILRERHNRFIACCELGSVPGVEYSSLVALVYQRETAPRTNESERRRAVPTSSKRDCSKHVRVRDATLLQTILGVNPCKIQHLRISSMHPLHVLKLSVQRERLHFRNTTMRRASVSNKCPLSRKNIKILFIPSTDAPTYR